MGALRAKSHNLILSVRQYNAITVGQDPVFLDLRTVKRKALLLLLLNLPFWANVYHMTGLSEMMMMIDLLTDLQICKIFCASLFFGKIYFLGEIFFFLWK